MAYKVIVRQDIANGQATWEPGCPLVVSVIQVSRDVETGACYLQAQLKNVSGGIVPSVRIRFEAVCHSGKIESLETRLLDLDLAPGTTRDLAPVRLRDSDVAIVRAHIEEAGSWRSAGEPGPLPPAGKLTLPEALAAERAALLSDRWLRSGSAAGSALVEGDGWWRCPCGGINVGTERCSSCNQGKDFWRQAEDPNFLAESAATREEAAKLRARKRRRGIGWAVVAACVALVAIGAFLSAFPSYQQEAFDASRQARHEAAYDAMEFTLNQSSENGLILSVKVAPEGRNENTLVGITVDWGGDETEYTISADEAIKELRAPFNTSKGKPVTVRVTNSETGEELFSETKAAVR